MTREEAQAEAVRRWGHETIGRDGKPDDSMIRVEGPIFDGRYYVSNGWEQGGADAWRGGWGWSFEEAFADADRRQQDSQQEVKP